VDCDLLQHGAVDVLTVDIAGSC